MVQNTPALWRALLPVPQADTHKYDRGHAVVLGGTRLTGAARLASEAAMRAGAGVCSIITAPAALPVYQAGAPHVLVESYPSLARFAETLADTRRNAVLMGPGAGTEDAEALRQAIIATLQLRRAVVLDADALSVFAEAPECLFAALHDRCVLTPHEGEFARLFPDLGGEKTHRTVQAAQRCRAVVLLKGAETIIGGPYGQFVCNTHASPWLATAGSGDVLAGIILALLAQGISPFDSAAAAAWIHGDASLRLGCGLVAPDLIAQLPVVLKALHEDG